MNIALDYCNNAAAAHDTRWQDTVSQDKTGDFVNVIFVGICSPSYNKRNTRVTQSCYTKPVAYLGGVGIGHDSEHYLLA